jgi:hypothetical protein
MVLHGPPFVPRIGGEKSNAVSTRKSQVERSSPTYRATEVLFFQLLNHFHRYLLGTKLAKEKAQLCQHLLDILRDVASNHQWKKPLNPYVVVMTLHP